MKKLPKEWKPRLRELSLGPYDGSMYRWTFHDGSTWAAVLFLGKEIVGWACLTEQEEEYPVVGIYISDQWRGIGLAEDLLVALLQLVKPTSRTILAVADSYPKYPELLNSMGYLYRPWE